MQTSPPSPLLGRLAFLAACVGTVLGPLHALARFATSDGSGDLDSPLVRWWAVPAAAPVPLAARLGQRGHRLPDLRQALGAARPGRRGLRRRRPAQPDARSGSSAGDGDSRWRVTRWPSRP